MSGRDDLSSKALESDKPSDSKEGSDDAQAGGIQALKERVELSKSDEMSTKVKVWTIGDGGFGIDGLPQSASDAEAGAVTTNLEARVHRDANNRPNRIEYTDGSSNTVEYDKDGNVTRLDARDGSTVTRDGDHWIIMSKDGSTKTWNGKIFVTDEGDVASTYKDSIKIRQVDGSEKILEPGEIPEKYVNIIEAEILPVKMPGGERTEPTVIHNPDGTIDIRNAPPVTMPGGEDPGFDIDPGYGPPGGVVPYDRHELDPYKPEASPKPPVVGIDPFLEPTPGRYEPAKEKPENEEQRPEVKLGAGRVKTETIGGKECVTEVEYSNGKKSEIQYDEQGNPVEVKLPTGGRYEKAGDKWVEYDKEGNEIAAFDATLDVSPNGDITLAFRDGSYKEKWSTNGTLETTLYDGTTVIRDDKDRVTEVKGPNGHTRKVEYGTDDKPCKITLEPEHMAYVKDGNKWKLEAGEGNLVADGNDVEVLPNGEVSIIYRDGTKESRVTYHPGGTTSRLEREGDRVTEIVDAKDNVTTIEYSADNKPNKLTITQGDSSVTYTKRDGKWVVEGSDYAMVPKDIDVSSNGDITLSMADGSTMVRHRDGSSESLNADGTTTAYVPDYHYPAGDPEPVKIDDPDHPLVPSIGVDGVGTLGRKPTIFDRPSAFKPEGATVTTGTDQWGNRTETVTKNGETVTNVYEGSSQITFRARVFELADGRKIRYDYQEGDPGFPTIIEPNGNKTLLTPVYWPDGSIKQVQGERVDSKGKVIETVTYIDGKLVYEDVKTHAKRAEMIEPPSGDHVTYQIQDLGKYDPDTGTVVLESGDTKVISSFASGRVDVQRAGGVLGLARNGEISFQNNQTGEASIIRPDGTGVYLHGDGTLDRWGPEEGDTVKGEKLSQTEQEYLKKHPDTDLRDFAEIHRRFKGDTEKLDSFYKTLEKIDTAKNLTDAEKAAVRKELIDHVANPAEIYQGVTDSCNVTVFERDLAMTNPAKYASLVADAISEGTFTAADGTVTRLDVKNLKMADSSGRDLASRIFQGAALQATFSPTLKYENTPDGIGRLKATKDSPRGTENEVPFDGLTFIEMANIRYKLTGEEKAITVIKSEADLKQALDLNGGPPMTIMVDATYPPFGDEQSTAKAPNHVVTISGIEPGPPVKYLVQNQWGLEHDHSTRLTAIPADQLLANMSRRKSIDDSAVSTSHGAIVISKGDHTRGYRIVDGHSDSPQELTDDLNRGNRNPQRTHVRQ